MASKKLVSLIEKKVTDDAVARKWTEKCLSDEKNIWAQLGVTWDFLKGKGKVKFGEIKDVSDFPTPAKDVLKAFADTGYNPNRFLTGKVKAAKGSSPKERLINFVAQDQVATPEVQA